MVTDRDMEPPNIALLHTMRSLLRELGQLPSTGQMRDNLGIIRANLEKNRGDLGSIRTNLEKLSEVYDHPLTVNYWKKDVRELSYDVEDFVDQLVNRISVDAEMGCVDEIIISFKARIEELVERYKRYKLEDVLGHITNIVESSHRRVGWERAPGDMVGMGDGPANDILRWLKAKGEIEKELKAGSILGTEGVGKSTLVQKVWRNREVEREFDCRAFVQTAKKPDMRMILRSILSQVHPKQQPDDCQVPNLIHDIRKHLQDKRYLIIIDDLWAVSVWDVISRAFPEGNYRSRILTTTTIEDVAMACCSYDTGQIFKLKPLSADQSKKLFNDAVFGPEKECPAEFNGLTDEIARKCGGLPLAIICIGNLIASQQDDTLRLQQCERIKKILHHSFETSSNSVEILNKVLEFYYRSLPYFLKSCLLYLSIYPENYLILKEDLVKQWIAEDFFSATKDDKIEVASSYFDELVSIGLIQRVPINSNKKQVLYAVHPTVFDLISRKSLEGNFITIIDYSQLTVELTDKIRRLALHFGSATYATPPTSSSGLSQVRSLTFMGLLNCMPSLVEFRLIRVVILHVRSDDGDRRFSLAEIDKLLLLRYLQVRCNVAVELPDKLQCLKQLETLEINAEVAAIPSDIAHVPWLTNVCIGGNKIHEHLTLGSVPSRKAIGMVDSSSSSTPSVQIFELLPPICIFSRIPDWISRLHKLRVLEIVVREVQSNGINILAELPVLTALSLYVRRPTARDIVCSRAAFPALEYFKLVCGVLFLNFEKYTMPNLRRLKIGFNAHRGGNYGLMLRGIQHLLNLEEIAASTGKATDAEEFDRITAESILRDAISNHPCHPSLKIKRVNLVDEEYDHSEIKDYCSQETEQCVIQENELSLTEPRHPSSMAIRDAISNHPCHPSLKIKRVDLVDEEYSHSEIKDYCSQETEQCVIRENELSDKEPRHLSSMVVGATWTKIKFFTEDEIARITRNYSTLIGKSGFGEVYRGTLDDDYDPVAVKRYIRKDLREEFMEEVIIHGMITHKNVVNLIGYCIGESSLMIVTEYISNGNLDDKLHGSDTSIPLDLRLGIAIGCAEALSYMHSMHLTSGDLICHGDFKPANILLDGNLTTKVSDFGLSRLLSSGTTRFTKAIKGSLDYMDPVYFQMGCLTPRNDVYSFGMVLFELITRKRAKYWDQIPTFNKACAKGKGLRELFDPEIAEQVSMKILKELWKLAAQCLSLNHTRPQMNEVAKRLRMLKNELKRSPQSIMATHSKWAKQYIKSSRPPSFKKKLSFFKGNTSYYKVLSELRNGRLFTEEEINVITHNYSYLLSGGTSASKVYKGTLEDNTIVAVHKLLDEDSKEAFINGGIIVSQISHNNIIKILGCSLQAQTVASIYEYAAKGSILDIFGSHEDFPLDLRMRIAIKTAEALQYLHSSETGIIGHGGVSASTIVLDDNFVPKLTEFSRACMLFKKSETTAGVISSNLLEEVLNNDPSHYGSVLMNLESDVYRFGGLLMAFISGLYHINMDDLVTVFTQAYETENTGKALFDKDVITDEEDIILLEELGRLALKCTILNTDMMAMRPTMKEVADQLRIVRISWRERRTKGFEFPINNECITQVTDEPTTDVPAEPRLPNLMRQLFGYRQVNNCDPIRVC